MCRISMYLIIISLVFFTTTGCTNTVSIPKTPQIICESSEIIGYNNVTSETDCTNLTDNLPYTVILSNGQTKEIYLPFLALNHIEDIQGDITGDGIDDSIIVYRAAHGTAVHVDHVRIFNGQNGNEICVPSITELLDNRMSIESTENGWIFLIDDHEYSVLTDQFDINQFRQQLENDGYSYFLETPIYHFQQRFFIDNNELYCEVLLVCNVTHTEFAKEAIYINFNYNKTEGLIIEKIRLCDRQIH